MNLNEVKLFIEEHAFDFCNFNRTPVYKAMKKGQLSMETILYILKSNDVDVSAKRSILSHVKFSFDDILKYKLAYYFDRNSLNRALWENMPSIPKSAEEALESIRKNTGVKLNQVYLSVNDVCDQIDLNNLDFLFSCIVGASEWVRERPEIKDFQIKFFKWYLKITKMKIESREGALISWDSYFKDYFYSRDFSYIDFDVLMDQLNCTRLKDNEKASIIFSTFKGRVYKDPVRCIVKDFMTIVDKVIPAIKLLLREDFPMPSRSSIFDTDDARRFYMSFFDVYLEIIESLTKEQINNIFSSIFTYCLNKKSFIQNLRSDYRFAHVFMKSYLASHDNVDEAFNSLSKEFYSGHVIEAIVTLASDPDIESFSVTENIVDKLIKHGYTTWYELVLPLDKLYDVSYLMNIAVRINDMRILFGGSSASSFMKYKFNPCKMTDEFISAFGKFIDWRMISCCSKNMTVEFIKKYKNKLNFVNMSRSHIGPRIDKELAEWMLEEIDRGNRHTAVRSVTDTTVREDVWIFQSLLQAASNLPAEIFSKYFDILAIRDEYRTIKAPSENITLRQLVEAMV